MWPRLLGLLRESWNLSISWLLKIWLSPYFEPYFFNRDMIKGIIFFYFPGKVYFCPLFGKNWLSEWKLRFISSAIFSPLFKNELVRGGGIFPRKKQNVSFFFWKKRHLKNLKNCIIFLFLSFLHFFCGHQFFGRWVADKLFLIHEKLLFFPHCLEKQNSQHRVSKRQTNFSGNKYDTFD